MISVIMSTYKEDESQLRQSIESILNQTYQNFEFIIILDNAENEMHRSVIHDYAARDSRIRFLVNEGNHGRTLALNRGLALAKGEYIAIMDADDISLPKRFEIELTYIEKNGYDLIGGITEIIDENGNDVKFEVIMYFEIEKLKGQYIIATPAFEQSDEAYAFKIFKDEDGSELFLALEDDDDEFAMVLETYETLSEDGIIE